MVDRIQTWLDLPFADGRYTFRLSQPQIQEIEKRGDSGIGAIYGRTLRGRFGPGAGDIISTDGAYRFSELVEIIRQGLIGGKHAVVDGQEVHVTAARANELVERYVLNNTFDRLAIAEIWALAYQILHALMEGHPVGGEA